MMKKLSRYLFLAVISIPFLLASYGAGYQKSLDLTKASLSNGGLLYDKWWKVSTKTKKGPKDTHPLYPSVGKKKGSATWRCKECHGWDYKGKDGAYKSGSHFTGIKGIFQARTKTAREVYDSLRGEANPNHDFSGVLSDGELKDLTKFIKEGMADFSRFIDSSTKAAKGGADRGKALYEGKAKCSVCHGADGKKLDFGKPGKPVYLGTLANKNPWETLHKTRFGHPGSKPKMPGGLVDSKLTDREMTDVLAYSQTLPKK